MNLNDIMQFTEPTKTSGRVLLIDAHNIAYMMIYAGDINDFEAWKSNFLYKIFVTIRELSPEKVVIAFDSKNCWRYSLYKEYKANRVKQHGKYVLDKKGFNSAIDDMVGDLKAIFPCIHTLRVDRTEGDDIIAILATHVFNKESEDVIIVSRDSDLNQLISLPNVSQYNPHSKSIVNVLNPKMELEVKIINGDSGDNIKGIKRGVGIKKSSDIVKNSSIDEFIESHDTQLERDTIQEAYNLNRTLIDLSFIPNSLKDDIILAYEEVPVTKYKGKTVMKYFTSNKMKRLYRSWSRISKTLDKLVVDE